MIQYRELLKEILTTGRITEDRTGVGTKSIFGQQIRLNHDNGFPIITTKKMIWESIVSELIWFMRGSSNLLDLRELRHGKEYRNDDTKKTIWDGNYYAQAVDLGYSDGNLGPIYGHQWRNFNSQGKDQLKWLIEEAKANPTSRRLLVTAWNPAQIDSMTLPPCHYGFQVSIRGDQLDLLWTQRSVDSFLGLPYNISSYALLQAILAKILGRTPGNLIGQFGDTHIYLNHIDQVVEQLGRVPYALPTLEISDKITSLESMDQAEVSDFKLIGYSSHPRLTGPMAV